jgi:diguanylate cyclase (GGDEF)-like protein
VDVNFAMAKLLGRSIVRHPWSSLRDALLLSGLMTFAVLLAWRYDLFAFLQALADPQRTISPPEAVLLFVLFVICVYTFIARRLAENRLDALSASELAGEMRRLRELAMQDPLTRLPNRRALLAGLEAATLACNSGDHRHAFFILDLNGFKRVNDLCGHAAGDHVLQAVVERFRRVARPTDLLARLGGDEFAVLSYDVDRPAAIAIGNRFMDVLANAISTDGYLHELGVAIGATLLPDDGSTCEAILHNADVAMYRAKAQPGSALAFFDTAVKELPSVREAG